MQEVFDLDWRVIECELLSGPGVRQFRKLRAGMEISGSGPDPEIEIPARRHQPVFPILIQSIILPLQVVVFLHPPGTIAGGPA